MYPRFRRVAVLPHRVRVSRRPVHDGPRRTARLINLETQVIVRPGDGMVMLVDDKVRAVLATQARFEEPAVRLRPETRSTGREG